MLERLCAEGLLDRSDGGYRYAGLPPEQARLIDRLAEAYRDTLFLLFAIAFGVDAVTRFTLGLVHPTDETEPLFYMARFATFPLIAVGIVPKNRPPRSNC